MKKHAFLIQAHIYPELLVQIINLLDACNHYFYIRIDKRSPSLYTYISNKYKSAKNVFVYSEKKINWGSSNQFMITVLLLGKALKCKDIDYFHLISGQDFPLKTNAQFDSFFEHTDNGYMGFVPDPSLYKERIEYFYFYNLINCRSSSLLGLIISKMLRWSEQLQREITKRGYSLRPALDYSLYKGSSWWSWSREIASYVYAYVVSHPEYVHRFKYTCCCDELFFHTLIMNSPFKSLIISNNYRYIDWTARGESLPNTLNVSDYHKIMQSGALFCRKIDPKKSKELIKLILKNVFGY